MEESNTIQKQSTDDNSTLTSIPTTIQEYRKLFQSDQMIYVVNKPLTHILPELYEDNNDFLLNNKIIPTNSVNLKKKVLKSNV